MQGNIIIFMEFMVGRLSESDFSIFACNLGNPNIA